MANVRKRLVTVHPRDIDDNLIPDPLSPYLISDLDEGATSYYGFINTTDSNWFIMKVTATAVRYVAGTTDYTTAWTGRAALTYDYADAVF